jgi:hypothetical protein
MGIAIAAIGFYRVRELVAALIIFSVLFGILGIALLTLFLIQELALKGGSELERAWLAFERGIPTPVAGEVVTSTARPKLNFAEMASQSAAARTCNRLQEIEVRGTVAPKDDV